MTQITSLIMAVITAFSTLLGMFGISINTTETEATYVPDAIDVAIGEFNSSLYDEDGTYIYDAMRKDFVNGYDMTSAIYGSTPTTTAGVFTIELTSKMLLSALSKVVPTDKIVTILKEEFLGDTTAKYKGFFNTSEGVLYIFDQFKAIDENFRKLTDLITETGLKNQLTARNTYIDSVYTVNSEAWAGVVKNLNNLTDTTVRNNVKETVYKWGTTTVNGSEARYAVRDLMRNVTNRTDGSTYPELYDKYATYLFGWEMEAYEYRETARIIDLTALMQGYILGELYYTFSIEDTENDSLIATYIAGLNDLSTCMNTYMNTMNAHPVTYNAATTKCYIAGATDLVVKRNMAHFDYLSQLYSYKDYFCWSKNETMHATFSAIHNYPYTYLDAGFTNRHRYNGAFKYTQDTYYYAIAKYYKAKGLTLAEGLTKAGFTGISNSSAFVYAEDIPSSLSFGDHGFWSLWAYVKCGNMRIDYKGTSSNHDHFDVYTIYDSGSSGWKEAVCSINMNITSNDGKKIYHWDDGNNFAYNRTGVDFVSFIAA